MGTGRDIRPLPAELKAALRARSVMSDPMSTGAAVRTFNVMLAEFARGCGGPDRGLGHDPAKWMPGFGNVMPKQHDLAGRAMADGDADFAHCLNLLRETDRDRYLACLLVPEAHRGAFAAIYAFNAEIARVRDVVRDPLPGEVRLQWWRDLANGRPYGSAEANPVAAALTATIERYGLPRSTFDRYIEARTFDLYDDPMPDRTTFEGYAGETASAIMQLCAMVLSPDEARAASDVSGHAGVALAVAGAMLLMPTHRARGQVYVPGDILTATGLDREAFLAGREPQAAGRAVEAFGDLGREHLAKAQSALAGLSRAIFPAYLPAALVGPVLERARRAPAGVAERGVPIAQWRRQLRLWRAARSGRF